MVKNSRAQGIRRGSLVVAAFLLVFIAIDRFRSDGSAESLRGGLGGNCLLVNGTIYKCASGSAIEIRSQDAVTGETRLVLSESLNGFETMTPWDHISDGWYVYGLIRRGPAVAPKNTNTPRIVQTVPGSFKPPERGRVVQEMRRSIVQFPDPPAGDVVIWRRAPLSGGASVNIPITTRRKVIRFAYAGGRAYWIESAQNYAVQARWGDKGWLEVSSNQRVMTQEGSGKPRVLYTGAPIGPLRYSYQGPGNRFCWVEPRPFPDREIDLFMMHATDSRPTILRQYRSKELPLQVGSRIYWLRFAAAPAGQPPPTSVPASIYSADLQGRGERVEADLRSLGIAASSILERKGRLYVVFKRHQADPSTYEKVPTFVGLLQTGASPRVDAEYTLSAKTLSVLVDGDYLYYQARENKTPWYREILSFENAEAEVSKLYRIPLPKEG